MISQKNYIRNLEGIIVTKKHIFIGNSEKYKSESVMVGRTRVDVIEKKEEAIVDMAVLNSIDSIEGLKKLVSTDRYLDKIV